MGGGGSVARCLSRAGYIAHCHGVGGGDMRERDPCTLSGRKFVDRKLADTFVGVDV